MKISLILMPWYRKESPAPEFAMTAAILKKEGHDVSIFDINSSIFEEKFLLRKYWKHFLIDATAEVEKEFINSTQELFVQLLPHILSGDPQVIIFKIAGRVYSNSLAMARLIKERYKNKIVIFSGVLVTSKKGVDEFREKQHSEPFDYIICGEDEAALPELIRSLEGGPVDVLKKEGKVIDATGGPIVKNLDDLPHYDFSGFDLDSYRFPEKLEIFISKGCPWHCSFCVDWLSEKKYRSMSGERIFREVVFQHERHKTRHFRFCDKTINGDIKAIDAFSDLAINEFKKDAFSVEWSGDAMIRPEMTPQLLSKMRRAGCVGLGYGIESGSDKVVRDMGKQFSIRLAEEVTKNTFLAGISTSINIMVGFPTERETDFLETMNFIKKNKEFIAEIRLTYIGCRILKDSLLYSFPDRFNLSGTDADFWMTEDGSNTYEERTRRYEMICRYILEEKIPLRVNSRVTKKVIKAA